LDRGRPVASRAGPRPGLRAPARRVPRGRAAEGRLMCEPLTIRRAGPADSPALVRLAQLDAAPSPSGSWLIAVVGDELQAAIALETGRVMADPFRPTRQLLELLRVRAGQLTVEHGRPA